MTKKKVVGNIKKPGRSREAPTRVVGAIKKSVRFTAECGCVYEYPDNYKGKGTGKPKLLQPCPTHKPLPEPRHQKMRQSRMLKVGKVTAEIEGKTRYHRDCEYCEGEYVINGDSKRRWIHSLYCPYTPMLWWHHGREKKDWQCPFGCPGAETPGGITHNWQCPWWDSRYNPTVKTPF